MLIEFIFITLVLVAGAYLIYKMLNQKESPLDLNKDGEVNTADAEVVVEKAKKNVRKAATKATTAVKSRAKSPK